MHYINRNIVFIFILSILLTNDGSELFPVNNIINIESDSTYLEIRLNQQKNIMNKIEDEFTVFLSKNPHSMELPELQIEQERLRRDLEIATKIYITLREQYEIERINESKKNKIDNEKIAIYSDLLPFNEQEELAYTYTEAGLYDDAILVYQQIITNTINLFGNQYRGLIHPYSELASLYLLNNDLSNAKYFFQKTVNLQSSILIQEQNNYMISFNILRDIYKLEEDISGVNYIDSLIDILNTNTDIYSNDSTISIPSLLINNIETNKILSEYSINDVAYDLIYEGHIYAENNLLTQTASNFIEAYDMDATIFDIEFLLNFELGDDMQMIDLDKAMQNNLSLDTLAQSANIFSGLINYKLRNYNVAIDNIDKYIQFNHYDIIAWQMKGLIYIAKEEWSNAIFALSYSRLINEEDFFSNLYLGEALLAFQEYADANYMFKRALMSKPNHIKANYNLALSSLFYENYKEAIKEFKNALLLDSKNKDIYYYLGFAYKQNNQYKQSLESFNKCVTIDSEYAKAHYELGQIYEIIFEDESAINEYEFTKQLIDDEDIIIDELNLKLGMLYYNNQEYKKAMSPLRDYALNNLSDYDVLSILGEVLFNEQRYLESIDVYNILLEEFPNNDDYYYKIAESYFMISNYEEALDYYEKVLIYDDENPEILLNMGIIYNKMSNYIEAVNSIETVINCGHINKNLLVQLGIAYGGQKKYLQSMQTFREALKFSLNDPIIHYQLAVVYQELNIYDLSSQSLIKYLNYYPNDYIGHYLLGISYLHLGRFDEAILSFQSSLKNNNGHLNSLYNIGLCYYNVGEYKKASQYLKSVLKKNPDHVLSRATLINIYVEQNKSKEAKKECGIIYMLDRQVYNTHPYCNN